MPRVFSSVREAWNGILSGEVPTTRWRASCSTVDAPHGTGGSGSDLPRAETQATNANGESAVDSNDEEKPFDCCSAFVQLADDENNSRKEIDIGTLTDDDLRGLKKDDPFLYHSIPSIRRRSYLFDDDDIVRAAARSSRRSSLPVEVAANADISQRAQQQQARQEDGTMRIEVPRRRRESMVKRSRRLSTEAHPSLVCDEILRQLQESDVGSDIGDHFEIWEKEL